MNLVSTVGDLVRALSAYPAHLPLHVLLEGRALRLATDLQIMRRCDMPAEGADVVQIVLQELPQAAADLPCPGPMVTAILGDPAASDWLKRSLQLALLRDPVDAANDAEVMTQALMMRAEAMLHGAL